MLKPITERNAKLLSLVVEDPIVKNKVAMVDGTVATSMAIQADGSVKVYPSQKWWSFFCRDVVTISFDDLCLTIIDALSGHATAKNQIVLNGLMEQFNDYRFRSKLSRDDMIDYIFLVYFVNFDGKTKQIMENGFSPFPENSQMSLMVNLGGETVELPFHLRSK